MNSIGSIKSLFKISVIVNSVKASDFYIQISSNAQCNFFMRRLFVFSLYTFYIPFFVIENVVHS